MSSVAVAHAIALGGLDGTVVNVEAHVGPGLVQTRIVGSADAAVREAADRVRAAFISCGLPALCQRLTVNLSPADIPKTGSSFDLAIAAAVLVARDLVSPSLTHRTVFAAEVSLDGRLLPCRGAVAIAWAASRQGFTRLVVAPENVEEAAVISGLQIHSCAHLGDLLRLFHPDTGSGWPHAPTTVTPSPGPPQTEPELADVRGQPEAVKALLVAAVGGHHLLLHGEPGAGKSLLAHRLASVLPDMSVEDALVCAAIRSLVGVPVGVNRRPPAEVINPSTSVPALVGGGSREVRPGAISLAHGGVLIVDEAPEFPRRALEALRQPLDDQQITTRRTLQTITFPARFQLVMTANPCPCGGGSQCVCRPHARRLYHHKLSGPVLDRIDIHQEMSQPNETQLALGPALSSAEGKAKVEQARKRAQDRWHSGGGNAAVGRDQLRNALAPAFLRQIDQAIERGWLSMRGGDRVLRLSWSVADLEGHETPTAEDFGYALDLRTRDAWN